MKRLLVALGCAAACSTTPSTTPPPVPLDATVDVTTDLPTGSVDTAAATDLAPDPDTGTAVIDGGSPTDSPDTVPVDAPRPVRTLPPGRGVLADILGLAVNPGDCPVGSAPADVARRAFCFRKLNELGIHRVRRDLDWAETEPAQGHFVWDAYDSFLTECAAHGVDVLATLDYGNPWASHYTGATEYYPPDDPGTYARWAATAAARFAGRIHAYELWNEPNAGYRFWEPTLRGDATAYGALALAAARAIHTADPTAQVAFGGTVFIQQVVPAGVDFARQGFTANPGLSTALGAFGFHGYQYYPPATEPERGVLPEVPLDTKVAQVAGMLTAAGADPALPLWLTEIGWPVTAQVTAAQQADYLVRAVLIAAASGVASVYVYTLYDGPHPEAYPPEDAFGLVGYDADPTDAMDPPDKPSFTALRTLIQTLGRSRMLGRDNPPGAPLDAWVLPCWDGTRHGWAVWRTDPAGTPWTWTPPTSSMTVDVVATDGTTRTQAPSVAIPVSTHPVFIREH